jgi:hypothetical protein
MAHDIFTENRTSADLVAVQFYEDLVQLGKSTKLPQRVTAHDRVINLRNITVGKTALRGDGTLGELVPTAAAIVEKDFIVARGPTANIEVGVEAKDSGEGHDQADRPRHRRSAASSSDVQEARGNPICVGFVGINFSTSYTSYEGRRRFPTDGKKYKHPIQEASDAEIRLRTDALPVLDEFLILKFAATNVRPYQFSWIDYDALSLEYNALLTRVSREYDVRF